MEAITDLQIYLCHLRSLIHWLSADALASSTSALVNMSAPNFGKWTCAIGIACNQGHCISILYSKEQSSPLSSARFALTKCKKGIRPSRTTTVYVRTQ